uniref:Uncharacterized protein n=1 Tax=Arundo donax TaxID=35708 RepID=A0A0A8YSZ4_ARUDO
MSMAMMSISWGSLTTPRS